MQSNKKANCTEKTHKVKRRLKIVKRDSDHYIMAL
jgi:hypothetical protein